MFEISPATQMGVVTLSVADLARSLSYYQTQIGLRVLAQSDTGATLGAGTRPLLRLHAVAGARRYPRATGLYHFALLVPSRHALARVVRHLIDDQVPVAGASDHFVSEALYLSDPDGHGIEIYRDRPRSEWTDADGNFRLTTDPIDLPGILAELDGGAPAWDGLDAGTVMGHVHLQVADENEAERFYGEALGMASMAHYPGAAFVSAGGYHHHLGLNSWHSRAGAPAPDGAARLLHYEIIVPDAAAVAAVAGNLTARGVAFEMLSDGALALADPSGNRIHLHPQAAV